MNPSKAPSLKRQMQMFISIALALTVIIMGAIWITYNRITLEQQAERMYSIQADMIGSAIKPAMMFADKKLATELITHLKINPDIIRIQVFTADGTPLVSLPEEAGAANHNLVQTPAAVFENNQFKLRRTVFHKQMPVGTVYVEFDLTALTGHKRTDIINILFIMAAMIFFGFLITMRLQQKLIKSEEKLHLAIAQAEAANQAKSDFLSTMSHELRTPIHGIIGLQRLISADAENLSNEQRENLMLAQQSAKSLRALVNDILDLAKIESGNMEVVNSRFDLQQCICDALVPFRSLALEKGLLLSLHITGAPKSLFGDESRLRQILLNLVGNAIKFTHRGKVSIEVSARDKRLYFAVRDTGIGIAPENLKHIFEPFVQVSSPSQSQQKGTGLGTSIAKRFVELMDGGIQAESTPGEGSCFSFDIPCFAVGSETINCTTDSTTELFRSFLTTCTEENKQSPSSTLRVLLAEDDPIGQRIASRQLSKAGMEVHIVENGEDAWKEARDHTYDLLLTDIRMPGMDGIELTRKIREVERKSNRPRLVIIGLSAHALEEVASECMEAGMDHFMTKPVDPDTILSTIFMSTSDKHSGNNA